MACISPLGSDDMVHTIVPRVVLATWLALACLTQAADVVSSLGSEWSKLELITGMHQLTDRSNGLNVRILEADASATVAINPIYLYLVISNDSSGDDRQSYIWLLPNKVEKVEGVTLDEGVIRVRAQVDADPEDRTKTAQRDLCITYVVRSKKLSNKIEVSLSAP